MYSRSLLCFSRSFKLKRTILFQIANLKAALAKKEGDHEGMQEKVSGSPGGKLSSRSPPNLQRGESYPEPKSRRKPKADVANFEVIHILYSIN